MGGCVLCPGQPACLVSLCCWFSHAEPMDLRKVAAREKLPCFYKINQWGNYDFCEHNLRSHSNHLHSPVRHHC